MARVIEKEEKKEKVIENSKTVVAVIFAIVAVAILAFLIVIIVLAIKQKNQKEDEETTYSATYTLENTDNALMEITLEDLEGLLDNDDRSKYSKANVYVFIYTPAYDNYSTDDKKADGETEAFQAYVINAIKSVNADKEDEIVLYVINLLSDDNKESESTVLTDNSITYPNGYALLEINVKKELEEKMTSYADVTECLESLASNE